MKAVALLYHDVVEAGCFESSGFCYPGTTMYKMDVEEFRDHLAAIRKAVSAGPATVYEMLNGRSPSRPLFLTFDDGGVSACEQVAGLLDALGWPAHFFIPTDYIGTPGFMSAEQIRMLKARGHVIGSHSCSHPRRLSHYGRDVIAREWRDSIQKLSDLTGERVRVASIPEGYYSRSVAEAAASAGIKVLFTSKPTQHTFRVGDCLVVGRYAQKQRTSMSRTSALAAGAIQPGASILMRWMANSAAKRLIGRHYIPLREWMLRASGREL